MPNSFRGKTKRSVGYSAERVIASLNPTLNDWFGYFCVPAGRRPLQSMDPFAVVLRAVLRRPQHHSGLGLCLRDHKQWPKAFIADLGLITKSDAHQLERQFR